MTENRRLILKFSREVYNKPITCTLIRDYHLSVNILRAEITPGENGHLLVDVSGRPENLKQGLSFLRQEKIEYVTPQEEMQIDDKRCIHCGACTAVCFSQALVIEKPQWELTFQPEHCIACGLCKQACPQRAILQGDLFRLPAPAPVP